MSAVECYFLFDVISSFFHHLIFVYDVSSHTLDLIENNDNNNFCFTNENCFSVFDLCCFTLCIYHCVKNSKSLYFITVDPYNGKSIPK